MRRRRHAIASCIALVIVVAGCDRSADEPPVLETAPGVQAPVVRTAAASPEVLLVEALLESPERAEQPSLQVSVWADGRYLISFGPPTLRYGGVLETALADARVVGGLGAGIADAFFSELRATDVEALDEASGVVACPDAATRRDRYTLTTNLASRSFVLCGKVPDADAAPLVRTAADVVAAALGDQRDRIDAYLGYGSALDTMATLDWTAAALVLGTITDIDLTEPRLVFETDEVVAGALDRRSLAVPIAGFVGVRPDEAALLAAARPGDAILALVGEEGEVRNAGFLDGDGSVEVTDPSPGFFSLGHAADVAAELELYAAISVPCAYSVFARPTADGRLGPLESLAEIALREQAIAQRSSWIDGLERSEADTFGVLFTQMTRGEVVVVTDREGRHLGDARPAERTRRNAEIRRYSPDAPIQVWTVPENETRGCDRAEYGEIARAAGTLVLEIPPDELEFDRALMLQLNLRTGRIRKGP